MKHETVGSLTTTLPSVGITPVTPTAAYFGVAQALMPGAQLLASSPSTSPIAQSLLSAHILECLCKAFLSKHGGATEAELRKAKLRHNLTALWQLASQRGLSISPSPRAWVECLTGLHDSPYFLRYAPGVHDPVLPNLKEMSAELTTLLETVRESIR